ncbi:MAG: hypothetical protein LBM25_06140 [Bacteroidales bacterium]|jgi:hypothetical protein|nr:hypothetical protein [Bacteroidales bacterium]
MKNNIKNIFCLVVLIISVAITSNAYSAPQPPNHPTTHGMEGDQPAGTAPIGTSTLLLLSLGGAYMGVKLYKSKKQEE